ncbi:MAG: DUF2760 domain-containing protein [Oligosphaeraceae bacterium]
MPHLLTAIRAFFAILCSADKAHAWQQLQTTPAPAEPPTSAAPAPAEPPAQNAAVHLLAILQREARLVDFLQEDVSAADDEQLGAAVRKIHDDAQATLQRYFTLRPVLDQDENTTVTIPADFDNRRIRLTGKAGGQPPFTATLIHRGWRAETVNLPTTSAAVDPTIIAPAEVER